MGSISYVKKIETFVDELARVDGRLRPLFRIHDCKFNKKKTVRIDQEFVDTRIN